MTSGEPGRIVHFEIGPDNGSWQGSLVVLDDDGRIWRDCGSGTWHLIAGPQIPLPISRPIRSLPTNDPRHPINQCVDDRGDQTDASRCAPGGSDGPNQ